MTFMVLAIQKVMRFIVNYKVFMQKSQIVRGLPAAVNEKVVTRFIVNCKQMAGCLLLLY